MREIKFRGFHKCKDGKTVITVKGKKKRGTWFYGSYCPYTWSFAGRRINEPQIIIHDENNENDGLWVEVVPETVGQFTGLRDKNGKEIYEGDIVFAEARFDCANMVVVWDKGSFVLVPCEKYKKYVSGCGYKDIRWLTKTVIGNIYENPELSGGKQ